MTRVGSDKSRPPDLLSAMERAFRSLAESADIENPDQYIELRQVIFRLFDRAERESGQKFNISDSLTLFVNTLWTFAAEAEAASSDSKLPAELILNAFETFVKSGEVVFFPPNKGNGPITARDLLSLVNHAKFQYLLMNSEKLGANLRHAAEFLFDDAEEIVGFAAELDSTRALAAGGDEEAARELSGMILGDGLVSNMAVLSDAFEDHYFGPFIREMGAQATAARKAHEREDFADADAAVERMRDVLSRMTDVYDNMRDISLALSRTLSILKKEVGEGDARELLRRHSPFMRQYASVGHDYTNIIQSLAGHIMVFDGSDDKLEALTDLEEICRKHECSNVLMLLELIETKVGISRLSADGMERIAIPREKRKFIFRIINELVRNAKKYKDRAKDESVIEISASAHDGGYEIVVEDNGVGIEDVAAVLNDGMRERPDLAIGYGMGLPGIVSMTREIGAEFELESELGVGTKATLRYRDPGSAAGGGGGGAMRAEGPGSSELVGPTSPERGEGVTQAYGFSQAPFAPLLAGATTFLSMPSI